MSRDIKHSDPIHVIGYNGQGTIKFPVKGYEDREHCIVKAEYKSNWRNEDKYWDIDIELPRWGRDKDAEPCNIQTWKNTQALLEQAIKQAEMLKEAIPDLEHHRKIGEADREAKRLKEEAEKQALIDADKPVGKKLAKAICDQMVKQARDTKEDSQAITFQSRGKRRSKKMRVVYTWSGLTLFNCEYSRISRKYAMELLADAWIDSVDTGDVADSIPNAKMAGFMMGGSNK